MSAVLMLPTPDGSMEVYEAFPDGAPKGAVIVIQEAFGVNDHIQDVTRRIAAMPSAPGKSKCWAVTPARCCCSPSCC